MSVFSKQMDCEPKLAECSKRSDSMKLEVLPLLLLQLLLLLLLLPLLAPLSATESCLHLFYLLSPQSKLQSRH